MTEEEYTPDQVIRAITEWQPKHNYGLHLKAGKCLGITSQRVKTLVQPGKKSVLARTLLRLLMAAHQLDMLPELCKKMQEIKINGEDAK